MCQHSHLKYLLLTLLLALLASTVLTTHAAADEGTPPPSEAPAIVSTDAESDAPADTGVAAPPDIRGVEEPALIIGSANGEDTSIPAPTEESSGPLPDLAPPEGTDSIEQNATTSDLSQLPPDTDVVVLDENGEAVPLVTQQAAETIAGGDPMWCPVGVTPGSATCSPPPSSDTFTHLISWLTTNNPAMAGVIWIAASYDSNSVEPIATTSITLSGTTLTNMANYALTVKGGWSGSGTTIVTGDPSTFNGDRLRIVGWHGDITLSDLEITGVGGVTALSIDTTKNITLTRVSVHDNGGSGASLDNCLIVGPNCTGSGAIKVTSSQFYNNTGGDSLDLSANGGVTLTGVVANSSTGHTAAYLRNYLFGSPVTVTGGLSTWVSSTSTYENTFNGMDLTPGSMGLQIYTMGPVTITNVTASSNTNWGIDIDNCRLAGGICQGTGGVTMSGMNILTGNGNGLNIMSNGAISISGNLVANHNGSSFGAVLNNSKASAARAVTLSGSSQFNANAGGLYIASKGTVTLHNITASGNTTLYGAWIDNCQWSDPHCQGTGNVLLTGTNLFQDNHTAGLQIDSGGSISLYNVNASWNGVAGSGSGLEVNNCRASGIGCTVIGKPVTVYGTNVFNGNASEGVYIRSGGTITLYNVTASGNKAGHGANLVNSTQGAVGSVKVLGTNKFTDNEGDGLHIESRGTVYVQNVTALGNGQTSGAGIDIDNEIGTGKSVTLAGTSYLYANEDYGLRIQSSGSVTINNLTASYNGHWDGAGHGIGADINNTAGTGGVTLTGTNVFNENYQTGLHITSRGAIRVNNLTVKDNVYYNVGVPSGGVGVQLNNAAAGSPQVIVLSGTNRVTGSYTTNLLINSRGSITISNLTASGSMFGLGAEINNCEWNGVSHKCDGTGNMVISGTNVFQNNAGTGLNINASGAITLSNANASFNGLGGVGYGASLENCQYDSTVTHACTVKLKPVTLNGTNVFSGNHNAGLYVNSGSAITANNITANDNLNSNGTELRNNSNGASGAVTLNGTNAFKDNLKQNGLLIESLGAVTLWNVTATGNGDASSEVGVYIYNVAALPQAVRLYGTNNLSSNYGRGLAITSSGVIAINNLTASDSFSDAGALLSTTYSSASAYSVALSGTNTFERNAGNGLYISSHGMVSLNNLKATRNESYGVGVYNTGSGAGSPRQVRLTGYGIFTENQVTGLVIGSYGPIYLYTTRITADNNGLSGNGYGAYLDNCQMSGPTCGGMAGVTISGLNEFSENDETGLYVFSGGAISVSNVTAFCNGMANDCSVELPGIANGVLLSNDPAQSGYPGVTLSGTNTFTRNHDDGLTIYSIGPISVNNVSSSYNVHGNGAGLQNSGPGSSLPAGVTLKGINTLNQNGTSGLYVDSLGAIWASNLTASNNMNGPGAELLNFNADPLHPASVTLTGINTFSSNQGAGGTGLQVYSLGSISITNLNASHNGSYGAQLRNNFAGSTGTVTMSGINNFNQNTQVGLYVQSVGKVTLSKISAVQNTGGSGLMVNTAGDVSLACGYLTDNTGQGMNIVASALYLSGVISVGNGGPDITPLNTFHYRPCLLP